MDHTYVMAAPLLKIKNRNGRTRIGASRLSTIVTLECAWLTWKARCKRIIGDKQHNLISTTDNEALNNLRSALNNRLREDISLTNPRKYGRKAYPKQLILSTWSRILENEESLPEDWLPCNKVLVGIPNPPEESHM